MKSARVSFVVLGVGVLLVAGCGSSSSPYSPPTSPGSPAACVPSSKQEFSYVLTGYAVSMFTVNSCTGEFTPTSPATVTTSNPGFQGGEQMVADPLGRFAYVANLVSNASDLSTISMYTVNPTTGVLTPTSPATIGTGWCPQGIAIDPQGRFIYTVNSNDATVSMFTINQTTGLLTPTSPATVSTMLPYQTLSQPGFLTIDSTGKFLYVTSSNSEGATVLMFNINQSTGVLTPMTPASVQAAGIPFQVTVAPSGKFAYAVNNWSGGTWTDGVSEYTVNPTTGVFTPTTQYVVPAGNGPTAVVVDPTSKYAYVVNRQDNTVSMYTIDQTTGDLTLNASASNPYGTIASVGEPFRIDFDPTGKFVYVTNEASNVSIYTVNTDGTLTAAGTTGVASGGLSTAFTFAP